MKNYIQAGFVAIATELFLFANLSNVVLAEDVYDGTNVRDCVSTYVPSADSSLSLSNDSGDSEYSSISHTRAEEVEEAIEEEIKEEIRLGEMEMLAQLIEAEAGNQDFNGKRLVADVVLNRVSSDRFPNSVEEVIFECHSGYYQFSCIPCGLYDKAGWYISQSSFETARVEYEAYNRLNSEVLFFTAGEYNSYSIPMFKEGDHYFGK